MMKIRPSTFFVPWLAMAATATLLLTLINMATGSGLGENVDRVGSAVFAFLSMLMFSLPLAALWPFFIRYCPELPVKSPYSEMGAGALAALLLWFIVGEGSGSRFYVTAVFSVGGAILGLTYLWIDKRVPEGQELGALLKKQLAWLSFWISASLLSSGTYFLFFRSAWSDRLFFRVVIAHLLLAAVWALLLRIVFWLKASRPLSDMLVGAAAGIASTYLVTVNMPIGGLPSFAASGIGGALGALVYWIVSTANNPLTADEHSPLRQYLRRVVAFWLVMAFVLTFLYHVRYGSGFEVPDSIAIFVASLLLAAIWPPVNSLAVQVSPGNPVSGLVAGMIAGLALGVFLLDVLRFGGVWLIYASAVAGALGALAFRRSGPAGQSAVFWADWDKKRKGWVGGVLSVATLVCWFLD